MSDSWAAETREGILEQGPLTLRMRRSIFKCAYHAGGKCDATSTGLMWQKPDSLVCNFHGGNEIDTCHFPGLWGTYLQIPGRVFLPVAARIPESTVPVRIERTVGPGHSIKSTWPGLTPFFPAGLVPSKSVADSQTSSWYGLPMIAGTEKKGESASGKCGLMKTSLRIQPAETPLSPNWRTLKNLDGLSTQFHKQLVFLSCPLPQGTHWMSLSAACKFLPYFCWPDFLFLSALSIINQKAGSSSLACITINSARSCWVLLRVYEKER